jgi:hypothetical protein
MSQSLDLDYPHHSSNDQLDGSSSTSSNHNHKNSKSNKSSVATPESGKTPRAPYEYLYLSHSGDTDEKNQKPKKGSVHKKKSPEEEKKSESDYIIMNAPISIPTDYDSKIVRVANPHRKLRRNKDGDISSANSE